MQALSAPPSAPPDSFAFGSIEYSPASFAKSVPALNFAIASTACLKGYPYVAPYAAAKHGVPLTTNQVGGMFGFFFTAEPSVTNFAQATQCDIDAFSGLEGIVIAIKI